jgi:putative transferase (TIGR04331 family)
MVDSLIYPQNYEEFKLLSELEQKKYLYYLPLLKDRLNRIHEIDETELFWERVFGFTLLIHIAQCLLVFNSIRKRNIYKEIDSHCRKTKKYRIPWDEKNYRDIFVNKSLGQSVLVGIYYKVFNENQCKQSVKKLDLELCEHKTFWDKILSSNLFELLKEIVIQILHRIRSPKTILFEVYWSRSKQQNIQLASQGYIQFKKIDLDNSLNKVFINMKMRRIISDTSDIIDDFDKFFFRTLKYVIPTSLIERFSIRKNKAESMLSRYPRLENIFNESISPDISLILALSARMKIKTYYIEHNYLQHQFLGNNLWYIKRKFDNFLSLGWKTEKKDTKHIASSSNYCWYKTPKKTKSIKILYISGVATKFFPHFSSGYGESGEKNSKSYINMKSNFFRSLNDNIVNKIYYKDYPIKRRDALSEYKNNSKFINGIKSKVHIYDEGDLSDSVELISKSSLCICDYLSTPYNQILLSNTPVIILFNKDTYFLDEEDFYDELINVGIFHTNPIEAAIFLNENFKNITNWWNSKSVQNARKDYLRNNFGQKNQINKYLLGLGKKKALSCQSL